MNDGNRFRQPVSNMEPVDPTKASRMMSDHMHHDFRPQQDTNTSPSNGDDANMPASGNGSVPQPKRSLKARLRAITKKQWIIISVVAVLLLGGGAGAYFAFFHKEKPVAQTVKKAAKVTASKPAPTTVASTLSGLQVDPVVNTRPVVGVMIENSTDARPQSGLDSAGVVFEAIAEGGITRFMALFQDKNPAYLGPVRSVRPYYIQWAMGFDAGIAHVGGSSEALQNLKDWKSKDLDQFSNGGAFRRIASRAAPHNVYTSMDQLFDLSNKKGYSSSTFTGFPRKTPAASKTPTAVSVDFTISSATFNAHYDYEAATNTYLRSVGGAPHNVVDEAGKATQLHPSVVVALVMPQGIHADRVHTTYGSIGSGQAYIFQDGAVTAATWKKGSHTEQLTFVDAAGAPVKLNPGQTWLTALATNDRVAYK
jgi:hypothetical protein